MVEEDMHFTLATRTDWAAWVPDQAWQITP